MGLFSGITGLLGGLFSSDEQEDAYKRAAEMAKFTPYNVTNPLGGAIVTGKQFPSHDTAFVSQSRYVSQSR